MAPAKQYKIAGETMFIYTPLLIAGLFAIKQSLKNSSFKWENTNVSGNIIQTSKHTLSRKDLYEHFAQPVIEKLNELGFKYEIKGSRQISIFYLE